MIENYRFGQIVVNGLSCKTDLKIIDDKVIGDWWRKDGHSICKEDCRLV